MGFEDYLYAAAVTPDDSGDLGLARGLYVGVTGNVAVTFKNGSSATFVAVPAGTTLRIQAKNVKSTGTTATSILALF